MYHFTLPPEVLLSLAKLTLILLIALVGAPLIRRPAMRAAFWSTMFIILPIVIFVTHGRSILKVLPKLPDTEMAEVSYEQDVSNHTQASEVPSLLPETSTVGSSNAAIVPNTSTAEEPASNLLGLIFFAGLILAMVPVLISLIRISLIRKKHASGPVVDVWSQIEPQIADEIPLYFSDNPSAPCTVGLFRGCILLPESSTQWTQRRLKSTLLHEAAHIRRKDPLIRSFASMVRAVLWFHPLIWLAHRQLVASQEETCDEIAVRSGIDPDDYAEDLLEAAKFNQSSLEQCLSMARWTQLGSRIRMILKKQHTINKPLTMKNIVTISITVSAFAFGLSSLGFSETTNTEATSTEAPELADKESKSEADKSNIEKKLTKIIIPQISLKETKLSDAIEFLRIRSAELDTIEDDPNKKGLNFVVQMPRDRQEPVISELKLKNVPLKAALVHVCELTEMDYTVGEYAVTIRPATKIDPVIVPRAVPLKDKAGAQARLQKTREIIIPVIHFENVNIQEAISFLRMKSVELDKKTKDPNKKGINFVLKLPKEDAENRIIPELRLRNVPLAEALNYICDATKLRWKVDDFAVTISTVKDNSADDQ